LSTSDETNGVTDATVVYLDDHARVTERAVVYFYSGAKDDSSSKAKEPCQEATKA